MAALAADIMTSSALHLPSDTSVDAAWGTMCARSLRHVCVTNGRGELIGLVSDSDILSLGQERHETSVSLRDVMKAAPVTRSRDTPLPALARVMLKLHLDAVPIVDGKNHPIGIVTSTALLQALGDAP
ncbi:MAG: CBS domain-containing protein [Myxococcales bacterium]|nr:CBS domain-containing protein [Myxococcales bacterium]